MKKVFILAILMFAAMCVGCESRAFYGWEAKMFYPNKTWDKDMGDPRQGAYQPKEDKKEVLTAAQKEEYKDFLGGNHMSQQRMQAHIDRRYVETQVEDKKSFYSLKD